MHDLSGYIGRHRRRERFGMTESSVTAHFPGLDVKVSRRTLADGSAEVLMVGFKATPSLDAVGRMLTQSLVLPGPALVAQTMEAWMDLSLAAWQPWLEVAGAFALSGPAGGQKKS